MHTHDLKPSFRSLRENFERVHVCYNEMGTFTRMSESAEASVIASLKREIVLFIGTRLSNLYTKRDL